MGSAERRWERPAESSPVEVRGRGRRRIAGGGGGGGGVSFGVVVFSLELGLTFLIFLARKLIWDVGRLDVDGAGAGAATAAEEVEVWVWERVSSPMEAVQAETEETTVWVPILGPKSKLN